jgi:WD40 repeat protein
MWASAPTAKRSQAVGATATEIGLWDVATGKARFAWEGHPAEVWYLAVSPDGKTLVSHAPGSRCAASGRSPRETLRVLGTRMDGSFFIDSSPSARRIGRPGSWSLGAATVSFSGIGKRP